MVRVDIIKVVSEWCWFCGNALGKLKSRNLSKFTQDSSGIAVS